MAKPNISKLVEQVVVLKKESEVDLTDVPREILPGRATMKNSAAAQYRELLNVLNAAIGEHAGAVFVFGPGAAAFAEVGEDEGPSLTLDASELYTNIAQVWYPTVRIDHVFALDCIMAFVSGLNTTLGPLGIRKVASPEFGPFFGRKVESLSDAVAVTRDVVRATLGDDLNVMYLNQRLAEKAVAAEWDLAIIPAVIINATPAETDVGTIEGPGGTLFTDLFYSHNILHTTTNEKVEKNEVLLAFKQLRAKMTPKPPKNDNQ